MKTTETKSNVKAVDSAVSKNKTTKVDGGDKGETKSAQTTAQPAMPGEFVPKRVRKFLRWLTERHSTQGGVTELRVIANPPFKQVLSAFIEVDCVASIVNLIENKDGPRKKIPSGAHPRDGEANFYFTLNPVAPALFTSSAKGFNKYKATADADIVAYSMVLVDVDATRPSGVSATDEEKAAAWKVARKIRKFLRKRNIEPLIADSGNGWHLLIPTVPYKNVPEAAQNARLFLKFLDKKFSTPDAKVDTSVYNPARICKLYGTTAVKGSNTADRPHRYAGIEMTKEPDDVDLFAVFATELAEFKSASAKPTTLPASSSKSGKSVSKKGSGWDFDTSVKVLTGVLNLSGKEYKEKDKDQGRIFEFKDCPHHTDHDGHKYECSVMVRSDGSFGGNCFHDDEAGWQEMKQKIGWDEHLPEVKAELGLTGMEYKETPNGLMWMKPTKDGVVPTPLANYTARVVRTTVVDDGEEKRSTLHVAVNIKGRTVPVVVPARDFASMNWVVEHLGASAILNPGDGVRDRTRHAIQVLSGDPPLEISYAYTGWCKVDEQWVYLHAGGAIGSDGEVPGIAVSLGGPLARFRLPPPPVGKKLARAIRASLKILDLAPKGVSDPLFAAVYRAPLGAADFSVYYCGPTGQGKTVIASLGQQHWGAELDCKQVPGNWSSTANANEGMAFQAKDSMLLVDDFAPGNTAVDSVRLHRDADRLFRAAGNGTGRGRMRADATLRPPKYPRGLIVATGEDVPKGQSVRARLLVVEMSPGMLDWDKVTCSQKDGADGRLAAAMAGYVKWLAGRYEELMKAKPARVIELRDLAAKSSHHRRTPGIIAELYYAVEVFAEFAVDSGAISAEEAEEIEQRVWSGLGKAAANQPLIQAGGEPAQRFLDLLSSAIASGEAHVAAPDGGPPQNAGGWGWQSSGDRLEARGKRIGWVLKGDLFLQPDASVAIAQRIAAGGSDPLAVGGRTLHKRLHEQGKLVAVDKKRKRLTVRRTLEKMNHLVLWLRAEALGQPGDDPDTK